jgi:hypothetical protein
MLLFLLYENKVVASLTVLLPEIFRGNLTALHQSIINHERHSTSQQRSRPCTSTGTGTSTTITDLNNNVRPRLPFVRFNSLIQQTPNFNSSWFHLVGPSRCCLGQCVHFIGTCMMTGGNIHAHYLLESCHTRERFHRYRLHITKNNTVQFVNDFFNGDW